jgi:hypothetical protein
VWEQFHSKQQTDTHIAWQQISWFSFSTKQIFQSAFTSTALSAIVNNNSAISGNDKCVFKFVTNKIATFVLSHSQIIVCKSIYA